MRPAVTANAHARLQQRKQRAVEGGGGRAAQMIGEYKEKVEGELKDICAEVLVSMIFV